MRTILPVVVLGWASVVGHHGCATRQSLPGQARIRANAAASSQVRPLSAAALFADIEWLCSPSARGRGSYAPEARLIANILTERFEALGYEVVRQPIPGGVENVIAIRRAGPKAVIVSAHYDHLGVNSDGVLYPGADDNASGVAVLLGLAARASRLRYRDTLIFIAFGAEEPGLAGSGAYIRDPTWPMAETKAIVNFDMVGRNFFEAGANRWSAIGVVGLDEHSAARIAAEKRAREIDIALVSAPASLVEVFGFEDRTDEWWFRRRGVPAVHFSTAMHLDYHRPTDTPDKLVPSQMAAVAEVAAAVVDALAK